MKIIRKYITKQMITPFIMFLAVFTFVLLLGNMIKLADLIINKGVKGIDILKLFLTYLPYLLSYTIPMSLLSATLLTFSRLSSDGEITALRASGINLFKLCVPIIAIGLTFSLFNIILNDQILTKARYHARKIVSEIGTKNPEAFLEPGTFIKNFNKYIIFIYDIEDKKMSGIRIYQPAENGPTRTIIAEKGEIIETPEKNSIKLKLINGTSDEPSVKDSSRFFKVRFKTYYVTLSLENTNGNIDKKTKDMTIKELKKEIENLKHRNIDVVPLISLIQKKLAMSFSCLAFVIAGIPLGIISKRSGKSIGLGMSLAVIIFYYLFLIGTEAIITKNLVSPYALWIPNIILILFGLFSIHNHMKVK